MTVLFRRAKCSQKLPITMTTFPTPLKGKMVPCWFYGLSRQRWFSTPQNQAVELLHSLRFCFWHAARHTVLSWPWWTDSKHAGQSCTVKYTSADRGGGQIQSKHICSVYERKHTQVSAELWYQLSLIEGNEIIVFDSHGDQITTFHLTHCFLPIK